jgi:hypothetical protein
MLNSLQANEQSCVPSEPMKPRNKQDSKPKWSGKLFFAMTLTEKCFKLFRCLNLPVIS